MATRNDTNDQTNKAADAARNATSEAARAAPTITDQSAHVGPQGAPSGAEIARRSAEAARETLQSGLATAHEAFQRITDQVTKVLCYLSCQLPITPGDWRRKAREGRSASRREDPIHLGAATRQRGGA